jgi:hypothetical protein
MGAEAIPALEKSKGSADPAIQNQIPLLLQQLDGSSAPAITPSNKPTRPAVPKRSSSRKKASS